MSGQVYVNNQKADKPGASFAPDVELSLRGNACPYVSRGGLKLEKALKDVYKRQPPGRCAASCLNPAPSGFGSGRKTA